MQEEHNPIIVALDVSTSDEAVRLTGQLKDHVGLFKVGLQLFTALGPSVVRQVQQAGGEVFLDLKLHDIPNTVAKAAVEAGRLGVRMLTLHTLGSAKMMRHTAETVRDSSVRESWVAPKLLGVTILTSMDQQELTSLGIQDPLPDQVRRLATLASHSGLDGVVASPEELHLLANPAFSHLLRVIPGIRPVGTSKDDQNRTTTPSEAIQLGADYLVIGRPITQAPEPALAAVSILEEIRNI
jgi:orotidine-5'-phosphate decarboxylase